MEFWEYEEQQTEMQSAVRDWILSDYAPNVFVTLTSRAENGMSFGTAERVFGTFAHQLKSYLFASKSKRRIPMVPIVEGTKRWHDMAIKLGMRRGTHIHCLMKLPGNAADHMEAVRRIWKNSSSVCGDPEVYCPNNNNWFLELDTATKQRVFVNYALKRCDSDTETVLWDFVPVRRTT